MDERLIDNVDLEWSFGPHRSDFACSAFVLHSCSIISAPGGWNWAGCSEGPIVHAPAKVYYI